MRRGTPHIRELWEAGGPFIGDEGAAHTRVTVDIDWWLTADALAGWNFDMPPVRWWQRCDNSQIETEVPNIKEVSLDQSIDNAAGSCTITLSNQWMDLNTEDLEAALGNPGWFTWNRGQSPEARTRWGHEENAWSEVLVPNALLRTYQGYGGRGLTVEEAIAGGYIILTGVWLVDRATAKTDGTLELSCRDVGKLLIDQMLMPPLVPAANYPLTFARWIHVEEAVQHQQMDSADGDKRAAFSKSGNQAWYGPSGVVHGHSPLHATDGDPNSFWVSVGNVGPTEPFSVEYLEYDCGDWVDTIYINPWAGNYNLYVSVMEDGNWVGGATIPYEPLHVGRYGVGTAYQAAIPYVLRAGVPWETPMEYKLDRAYHADKVRITFTNLARSPWGPYPYRAGVREVALRGSAHYSTATSIESVRKDGNYRDYADIIKHLLLWAGWWCQESSPTAGAVPEVYGNIESTGVPGDDFTFDYSFGPDVFDKRPVIDAINQIKELVGYIFWIDAEGGARFESPNWWGPGNFWEDGSSTDLIPEFDERKVLTGYQAAYDGQSARSEIIVSSSEPWGELPGEGPMPGTVLTRFIPPTADALRGMVNPVVYPNQYLTNPEEQRLMAELIALHIWFQQRQGSVTCVANPLVGPNDQVRIYERQTAETYIHYVRSISTTHNLESGEYTMTLTTNWLGDKDDWTFTRLNRGEHIYTAQ